MKVFTNLFCLLFGFSTTAQSVLNIESLTYREIVDSGIFVHVNYWEGSEHHKYENVIRKIVSLKGIDEFELNSLFEDDVEKFYHLKEDYSTPLQFKALLSSPEYQLIVDSMKLFKEQCKKGFFYMSLGIMNNNYDVNKQGFEIAINLVKKNEQERTIKSKILNGFSISILNPVTKIQTTTEERYSLFIPVSESKGLEIEKLDIYPDVWLLFDFKDYVKIPCQSHNTINMIVPKTIRMVIVDTDAEKIIYSKTYKAN